MANSSRTGSLPCEILLVATLAACRGDGGGAPSDIYSVDRQRSEANLMFVNAAREETQGRFEVVCAEG